VSNGVKGSLIIIGGHEDKQHDKAILEEVANAVIDGGHLAIMTVATQSPEDVASQYRKVFRNLGVSHIDAIDIRTREDGHDEARIKKLQQAHVIFFTGGDQLRITSQLSDSPLFQCLSELYRDGATIAGTSAGAAAMPETMLISGAGDESSHISALGMAPGLGLIEGVVIDSHFAERGRIGRLVGAVAQNPRNLGLGIDEDTAIIVEKNGHFRVVGSGAVYVVDGTTVSYSSLSEEQPEGILSIFDLKLHILGEGDQFDLEQRRPITQDDVSASR
jgi:cyanophycinase